MIEDELLPQEPERRADDEQGIRRVRCVHHVDTSPQCDPQAQEQDGQGGQAELEGIAKVAAAARRGSESVDGDIVEGLDPGLFSLSRADNRYAVAVVAQRMSLPTDSEIHGVAVVLHKKQYLRWCSH